MLKVVSFYQIISALVVLVMVLLKIPVVFTNDVEPSAIFMFILLFFIAVFYLFSNVYFLLAKLHFKTVLLKWNFYISSLQILTISLIGVSYDFVFGIRIMPYFSYGEIMDFRLMIDSFDSQISIFYKQSSVILFGINLIPLFLSIIYWRQFIKSKAVLDNQ